MTKREYFAQIKEIVAENEELVAFIDHEVELLDKKNSRKSDKPTKKQVANEAMREQVIATLQDVNTDGITAVALAEAFGVSTQKMAQIVKPLVDGGTVEKYKDKKVTCYKIA